MTSTRAPLAAAPDGAEPRAPVLSEALAALGRTAARALSARTAVLALEARDGLRLFAWSFGESAGLGPAEGMVAALCARVRDGGAPLAVAELRDDLALRREGLALAGESSFAGVPIPGGVLAVVEPCARAWGEPDLAVLADLARLATAELERQRLDGEREALASALSRATTRYRCLLSTCPGGVCTVDLDGRITEVSPAFSRIVGRGEEELVGARFDRLVAPGERERALSVFLGGLRAGAAPDRLDARIVRPDGEPRALQVVRAPLHEAGRVVGVLGVVRDVTDDRAREARLRRTERMASVAPLLGGVCHELNNPLTSIQSYAELMLLDDRSEEDRESLEIVFREAHRAAKIVSDLRVVARQSQDAGATLATVRIGDLLERVADRHRERLEAAGVALAVDVAPDLPPVSGVHGQLEQVVHHLLSNAEHAMRGEPGPHELSVRAFPGELGVSLLVSDTGRGIPAGEVDRIFDPFWTTRAPGEGIGLGLSVAQSILADHGGRISVQSRPGRGSSFLVELPADPDPPLPLTDRDDGAARRALRILVVDDEDPVRFVLARYLERRGHHVTEVADAATALRFLEGAADRDAFDIVLADLRTPGLAGDDLLSRLRGDGLDQRLVLTTGAAEHPDAELDLHRSGVPLVAKPFELAEVAQILEAHASLLA